MSVEKIIRRLASGDSDANLRFGDACEAISGSTSSPNSGILFAVMKPNGYEMIIWWSAEDDSYVVEVPELPGCMAHGKTRLGAIRNAEEAIRFWIKTARE